MQRVVAIAVTVLAAVTAVSAQPVVTGVSGGAITLPGDTPAGQDTVVGSLNEEWILVEGRGFGPDAIARLRAPGVNSEITSDGRLRRDAPDEMSVRATFGTEADMWSIEITSGEETSRPYPFLVVPPRPVIQQVEVLNGGIRRSTYKVRLTGTSYAATSEVLVNGQAVATEPIRSSEISSGLTVGLMAEVAASAFREGSVEVRVRTPGSAGGGISRPAVATLPPVPWYSRPEVWFGVLVGIVGLGIAGYRSGVRRARDRSARIQLEEKVSERTSALDAALATQEAQAAALREVADQRARAFAGITHDLRTPLTVVLASLDNVIARDALDGDDRAEVDAARRAGGQLVRLSASLSEAAEHESGQFMLSLGPLDVGAVARDVLAEQVVLLETLGLTVSVEMEGEVWVQADKWAVRRVLTNLVDNAGKFTPEGGSVTVSVLEDDGRAVLRVRDTGAGFAPDFVGRAFEAYVRDESPDTSRQGVGLGLSVVRDLVERMDGSVWAEPGPGGSVTVTFPLTKPVANEPQLLIEDEKGAKPRVVVAEDDPELRALLARTLEEEYKVVSTADGAKAFEAVRQLRPAVVVSDIMMPELDGVGLVRALRSEPWGRDVPIVLVTALDASTRMVGAFEAGADDYVTKPFDRAVLLARVRRLVGGRSKLENPAVPVDQNGDPLSPEDARLIEAVREAVEAELDNFDFDVISLGRTVGLSKAQLGRRLRDALNLSPAKYVERVRLDHAAGLLRSGGRLVKEVAGMVGYRDVKTFSRAFKRQFGSSPSKWGDDSA